MSRVSCFVPVALYHDYRKIPFSVADACQSCFPRFNADELRATDPRYALLHAVFALGQWGGSSLDDIVAYAMQNYPQFSDATLRAAFRQALRSGVFASVVPAQIDYLTGQNGPSRYVIGVDLDRYAANAPLTKFLLSLVGGYKSPQFVQWFSLSKMACVPNASVPCGTCQ